MVGSVKFVSIYCQNNNYFVVESIQLGNILTLVCVHICIVANILLHLFFSVFRIKLYW